MQFVSSELFPRLLDAADSVIVGSAIKVDGNANNRVDPIRASGFAQVAAEHGLT